MKWIILFALLASIAYADCYSPTDGGTITESVTFCSDTFDIPNGVSVTGRNFVVDCNTAVLRGLSGTSNMGVHILNAENVTFANCNIVTFDTGIIMENTTHATIDEVNLLKNKVGIRLLNSYENEVIGTNDKSRVKAVSLITSKFNTIILNNKQLHEEYCEENSCNKYIEMDVCVSNDFYCSSKCTIEEDADCGETIIEPLKIETGPTVEDLIMNVKREQYTKPKSKIIDKQKVPVTIKIIAYLLSYIIALGIYRSQKRG